MATPTPPTPTPAATPTVKRALSIIVLVGSALAFNWLSSLWAPTGIVLVVIVGIVLVLLWFDTSSSHSTGITSSLSPTQVDMVKFCLASILLGAFVFAAVALIPIWADKTFNLFTTDYYFHGSELLCIGILAIPGIVSALRRRNVKQLLLYTTSVVIGLTITYTILYGSSDSAILLTFLGWWLALAVTFGVVAMFPDLIRIFKAFL